MEVICFPYVNNQSKKYLCIKILSIITMLAIAIGFSIYFTMKFYQGQGKTNTAKENWVLQKRITITDMKENPYYHLASCETMKTSERWPETKYITKRITILDAENRGYTECPFCVPKNHMNELYEKEQSQIAQLS